MNLKIECAAIWDHKTNQVFALAKPNRHHDIIRYMTNKGFDASQRCTQGFLTNNLDFVDREQAALIANKAGQIKEVILKGIQMKRQEVTTLYSEDCW